MALFCQSNFLDMSNHFSPNLKTHFQNSSTLSKNMRKLRVKLCNASNYPP